MTSMEHRGVLRDRETTVGITAEYLIFPDVNTGPENHFVIHPGCRILEGRTRVSMGDQTGRNVHLIFYFWSRNRGTEENI